MWRVYPITFVLIFLISCNDKGNDGSGAETVSPLCNKNESNRIDYHTPQSVVIDWGEPVRLGNDVNTLCPEDAIEISADGNFLYIMYTSDFVADLTVQEILADYNNTYRLERTGNPGRFSAPVFFDLGKGSGGSLDGELSFSSDNTKVYFHSNRGENLGYNHDPFYEDFLDIYVAELVGGVPGRGVNLGPMVNSIYPDGEHAIHPDDKTLYFTSLRPGGFGESDIYISHYDDSGWTAAENAGYPLNSPKKDLQPTFNEQGDTIYFASDRIDSVGMAIFRAARINDSWGVPELIIRGLVGEPAITSNGQFLYFVHVESDSTGAFDIDVWYSQRVN